MIIGDKLAQHKRRDSERTMSSSEQDEPGSRIAQYWDDTSAPGYVEDLFDSFRILNPDFQHCIFSYVDAERFIGARFGQRELTAFRACAVPSMQSDYFRYCFVLAMGGIYADADYKCVRPLRPLMAEIDGGELFLGPTPHRVAGREARRVWSGFFAFRQPGHPFLRLALDIATANVEARIPDRVWPEGDKVVESIWLTVGPGVPSLMRLIYEWGSLDAFVESAIGTPAEPFADLYCETIGSYSRVVDAFNGVKVSSFDRLCHWVVHPEHLPYKNTSRYWHNFDGSIFK